MAALSSTSKMVALFSPPSSSSRQKYPNRFDHFQALPDDLQADILSFAFSYSNASVSKGVKEKVDGIASELFLEDYMQQLTTPVFLSFQDRFSESIEGDRSSKDVIKGLFTGLKSHLSRFENLRIPYNGKIILSPSELREVRQWEKDENLLLVARVIADTFLVGIDQEAVKELLDQDMPHAEKADLLRRLLNENPGFASAFISLDLSGLNLTEIPEELCLCRNLQVLNLSNNQLRTIPSWIGQLRSLRNVTLSNNQLEDLPASFIHLQDIFRLDLSNNLLTTIPESVTHLANLVTLEAKSNRIRVLPESIHRLVNLSSLLLQHNRLRQLPDAICTLPNLRRLSCSSNSIDRLPVNFGQIALLRLDLSLNCLGELPESLGQMQNLVFLDISNNSLVRLPSTIGGLTSLWTLYLENNFLDALPASFSQLRNVDHLDLSNNRFKLIPFEQIRHCPYLKWGYLGFKGNPYSFKNLPWQKFHPNFEISRRSHFPTSFGVCALGISTLCLYRYTQNLPSDMPLGLSLSMTSLFGCVAQTYSSHQKLEFMDIRKRKISPFIESRIITTEEGTFPQTLTFF